MDYVSRQWLQKSHIFSKSVGRLNVNTESITLTDMVNLTLA